MGNMALDCTGQPHSVQMVGKPFMISAALGQVLQIAKRSQNSTALGAGGGEPGAGSGGGGRLTEEDENRLPNASISCDSGNDFVGDTHPDRA